MYTTRQHAIHSFWHQGIPVVLYGLSTSALPTGGPRSQPVSNERGDQDNGKSVARMPGTRIPDAVNAQMADRVTVFNREAVQDPHVSYRPRYQSAFLYFDR